MAYLLENNGPMTMLTFLLSSVKSREGGRGLSLHLLEKRGSGLLALREEYDHGHLLPFLNKELLRWSWQIV
jgi:hypothetical protein